MTYQLDKCQLHNLEQQYINLEENTEKQLKLECFKCVEKKSISIEELILKFKQFCSMPSKIIKHKQIFVAIKNLVQQSNFVLQSFQQLHHTITELYDKWSNLHQQFQDIEKLSKTKSYNRDELHQIAKITLNLNVLDVPNFEQDWLEYFKQLSSKLQQIDQIFKSNPLQNKLELKHQMQKENQQKIQQVQQHIVSQQKQLFELSKFQTNIIVYALAFSFDSTKIVIGGGSCNQKENQNLIVLGLDDHQKLQRQTILYGHSKRVTTISYSKNEHFFVSGSLDSTLRLWKFNLKSLDWLCIKQLNKHTSTVLGVAINNTDQQIVSCGYDSQIIIWKQTNNDWQESQIITDHIAAVNGVTFSDDNMLLASASEDSNVFIWRNQNDLYHKVDQINTNCKSFIYCVQFIKNNSLIVGTYDGNISIWKQNLISDTLELCSEINPNFGYIKKIVYNELQQFIITKCEHSTIVWRILQNEKLEFIQEYKGEYLGIGLSQALSIIAMYNCQTQELQLFKCNL